MVEAALRQGERPDLATPLGAGVLDELVAMHEELGILGAVGDLAVTRQRAGVGDEPLLRTLPFLPEGSLSGATEVLFREPALLLRLGWSPVEIRSGANGRHRHPDGRRAESLPCHVDTLRDMLRRVPAEEWAALQQRGVRALYERGLIRGTVYAIDGSGIGPDLRLVSLVCVSAERPIVVAWRLLEGAASEKGREASVTRALIEQTLAVGGADCIRLLLADALYADGPLLAWLKYAKGIDAVVRLPVDRRLYTEARVAVGLDGHGWSGIGTPGRCRGTRPSGRSRQPPRPTSGCGRALSPPPRVSGRPIPPSGSASSGTSYQTRHPPTHRPPLHQPPNQPS